MPKIVAVLLCLAVATNAHNWMSSPSRANNNFNAYMQAPCPPRGARVHFQVQAGQKFPFEYATGHGTPARGGVYVTVLKAEDSAMMKKHTRTLLDDYLENPPAGHSYMSEHKAHHIGIGGGASLLAGNVRAEFDQYVANIPGVAHIRDYKHWTPKPGKSGSVYKKTQAATKDDIRVSYANPKYPWIVAAHKFKLHEDKTDDADLVMMEIPAGSAPGMYVVQYTWNGYYDCTDVLVIEDQSTDFYGGPGGEISYDKVDHCLWNPDTVPPKGQQKGFVAPFPAATGKCRVFSPNDSNGKAACDRQCNDNAGCTGVQIVPLQLNDPDVIPGLFVHAGGQRKTYPEGCGALTGNKYDLVCFPVKKGNSVVGGPELTTIDPRDPVFYGTCYKKGNSWVFANGAPNGGELPPDGTFRFGEKCITCASAERNKNQNRIPFWNVTTGPACDHCDSSLGRRR